MSVATCVGVMLALFVAPTLSQSLSTVNGSIVLQTGGASLTLTGPPGCGTSNAGGTLVYQTDLQAILTGQIQPQVGIEPKL